jgi:hypothetical protein
MNERQKRLIEVYDYVRQHFGIHTKQGFAEALNYGRTSMSAALNGNEGYLTDSLFKSICATFPGVFNLDYLLTGEGSLLVDEGSAKVQDTDSGELEALKNRVKLLEEQVARQRQIIDHYETVVELALSENRQLKQTIDNPFVSDKTPASAYEPPAKK